MLRCSSSLPVVARRAAGGGGEHLLDRRDLAEHVVPAEVVVVHVHGVPEVTHATPRVVAGLGPDPVPDGHTVRGPYFGADTRQVTVGGLGVVAAHAAVTEAGPRA